MQVKQRVLITGATGFIGRCLVPRLVAEPETAVTILIRETYSGRPLPPELAQLRPHFHVVYADLRNFQLTLRAVKEAQADCVIHLAAAGATDPFLNVHTAIRHNLTGTLHLLRACCEKSSWATQVIVARTPGELTTMNNYAASKAATWQFCRMFARTQQWPIHGAMIFQAYGPTQPETSLVAAATLAAIKNQDFPMTAGTQTRDWVYVDDVVAGIMAMRHKKLAPGTSIDLGTGCPASVAKIVRQIYRLTDSQGRPRVGILPSRPGEEPHQVADANRTKEMLGWETAVSLSDGLSRVRDYFLTHS